ncbi:MAG: hypothetical protein DRR08_05850 [Candidatus Parabeggiatoa sp. nov. 2]|nr:MAG: hypothetical protein B6247_02335 [Beggiatoa sp. 4572_84]RKZ62554.1 MAG: hypothetical protein DRR08_05850 [Gammaproteobacteria bacterium]
MTHFIDCKRLGFETDLTQLRAEVYLATLGISLFTHPLYQFWIETRVLSYQVQDKSWTPTSVDLMQKNYHPPFLVRIYGQHHFGKVACLFALVINIFPEQIICLTNFYFLSLSTGHFFYYCLLFVFVQRLLLWTYRLPISAGSLQSQCLMATRGQPQGGNHKRFYGMETGAIVY